jgi:hypothetical protein
MKPGAALGLVWHLLVASGDIHRRDQSLERAGIGP